MSPRYSLILITALIVELFCFAVCGIFAIPRGQFVGEGFWGKCGLALIFASLVTATTLILATVWS
jgi:hypothetical protein